MEQQFLYFFLAIMMGFACLIFFLLKLRKSLFKKSLLLTAGDVWKTIEFRATALGLEKNNLIYGLIQDHSFTEAALLIRNSKNESIGNAFYPTGIRKRRMTIDNQKYLIDIPLTMNKKALLRKGDGQEILASYVKTNWSGKHEFEIPGQGKLVSNRPFLNLKASYEYSYNGKIVGIIQNISTSRKVGRLAILPESLPLEVRSFMLSV